MAAVVRRNRWWMREEREKPEREGKEMNRWSVKIARPFWSVGSVLHVSRAASPPAVDAIWDGGWESAARPCKNTAGRVGVFTYIHTMYYEVYILVIFIKITPMHLK